MIDFKLNDKGDIIIGDPEEFDFFRINFVTGEYPKFRMTFKGEAEEKIAPDSVFSLRFFVDENEREHAKIIETVDDEEEKAQSVAIRLKTELGELNHLYYDFGSELTDYRHKALLNQTIWSELSEKVKEAIRDVIPYDESKITIERIYPDENFQIETLQITISDGNTQPLYSYRI